MNSKLKLMLITAAILLFIGTERERHGLRETQAP